MLVQNRVELDQLVIATEVIRKDPDEVLEHPREGAFIAGLYLEGARWNISAMRLEDAVPREMFCALPVLHCKAVKTKVRLAGGAMAADGHRDGVCSVLWRAAFAVMPPSLRLLVLAGRRRRRWNAVACATDAAGLVVQCVSKENGTGVAYVL